MTGILVDSNVLIDLFGRDQNWFEWSYRAVQAAADTSLLIINPAIYAEVSARFDTIEEVDEALPEPLFRREAIPWEAAFLAGKCFIEYRRRGGARRSPLPDFFIGAHAAVMGYRLLTRDPQRYRSYFPTVSLIAP